jgi:hypothetical protein
MVGDVVASGLQPVPSPRVRAHTPLRSKPRRPPRGEDEEAEAEQSRPSLASSSLTNELAEAKRSVGMAYEFSGMHYIFDHHKKGVRTIKYGNPLTRREYNAKSPLTGLRTRTRISWPLLPWTGPSPFAPRSTIQRC